MSAVSVSLSDQETGTSSDQCRASQSSEAPCIDLHGLSAGQPSSADGSPSPSAETTGLLSLPWEILTHINSYIPAQCLINVLPKVCHALATVAADSTEWQLRARRLIGSKAGFPVVPLEGYDWPTACMEIEQLKTCWTSEVHHGARQTQEDEEERDQMRLQERDQVARELEEGLEDDAVEGNHRMDIDADEEQDAVINHLEDLEYITLPLDHIAAVNSVLHLGGEGTSCATASRDRNVKLWDLQAGSNGTLLHTLGTRGEYSTHQGWVWCLASRGPLLASGAFDSTVRLWDVQAGGASTGLIRTGGAVLCLSCQTDVLLAGTFDKKVNMYDIRGAQPLVKSLELHGDAVMCLAADDKYIISGSKDCTVAVYDRTAGKDLQRLRLSSYLLSMSYSGCEVWTGDNSGMLQCFSLQAGSLKALSQFDVGHTDLVTGIHKSSGSLYTCSADRTVKVHLPCAPPRTLCILRRQAGVSGLSVEAGVLAVASDDEVAVWRPRR
ncbi:F-box/WD repeat-containing protein 9 isoform X2 [Parambassis ranga]|uniref:F-box/WD repeat-containing protein 9 isoform X2 n=1 Tax=Parambassis ranga TaxID=210632 RepID=A0A6P7ISV0_9TELE|nr:F-box/WD repeat-containing protein 9 isoform X2 [Parambassis ranga]